VGNECDADRRIIHLIPSKFSIRIDELPEVPGKRDRDGIPSALSAPQIPTDEAPPLPIECVTENETTYTHEEVTY